MVTLRRKKAPFGALEDNVFHLQINWISDIMISHHGVVK